MLREASLRRNGGHEERGPSFWNQFGRAVMVVEDGASLGWERANGKGDLVDRGSRPGMRFAAPVASWKLDPEYGSGVTTEAWSTVSCPGNLEWQRMG